MRENSTFTKGAKISIVDDDESMREALKALIGSMGLSVDDFPSAEDFLNSGRPQLVDCLILDVMMPGLSGWDLQERLRSEKQSVPIVFITAHYSEKERARALEAGAVDFLAKPFTEQELLLAISTSLTLRKKRNDEATEF